MTLTRGLHHPPSPALVSPSRASPAPQKRKGGGLSSLQFAQSLLAVKRRNTTSTTSTTSTQKFQLCRLCATGDFAVFSLEKKPEIVVKVKELLNISLDLEADRKAGYPAFICIQCCNNLQIVAAFKGNVARAQMELEQRFSREVEVISDLSPER